jgi:radical SAM superfamily enzyme YgiQ (UPF0313 family)
MPYFDIPQRVAERPFFRPAATLGRDLEIRLPDRILLLEGSHTMYMPTPSLGIDRVAHIALKTRPSCTVTTAILSYAERNGRLRIEQVRTNLIDQRGCHPGPKVESLEELLRKFDPTLIGIGGTSKDNPVCAYLLSRCGVPCGRTLVVAGGIHVTRAPLDTMRTFAGRPIDICLPGPAENNFAVLLAKIELAVRDASTRPLLSVPNSLVFARDNGECFITWGAGSSGVSSAESLVSLSRSRERVKRRLPALDVLLPPSHFQRLTTWDDTIVVRFQSAEGCQYACNFCAVKAITRNEAWIPYDLSAIEKFLQSIEQDRRLAGIPREKLLVYLEDGQIGGPAGSPHDRRARALLDILKRYPYRYGVQARYDPLNNSFLDALAAANVRYIFTSLESLSPEVLRRMNKGQHGDPEEIYASYKRIREHGIEYMISFIGGMQNEPFWSVPATAAFIPLLSPRHIAFEIAKVYPGTSDAVMYQKEHGVNVAEAYSSFTNLAPYSANVPIEERGCVLQHLDYKKAGKLHCLIEDILLRRGKLRKEWEARFAPLGSTDYEIFQPGFYSRRERLP